MKSLSHYLAVAFKGFGMGAANVVPGVSGGTIALLTGIYSNIVNALNAVTEKQTWQALLKGQFREFWRLISGDFLVALLLGVLVSVFSLAKVVTYCLAFYPILTWAFFFGLILASTVIMFRDVKDLCWKDAVFIVVGIVIGVVVCTLSPTQTTDDLWFIFVCGALSICAMILPGISGSFILLVMGKYEYVMQAVSELNWPIIIVFALGCVVGILAFAKFLHWLLARWERQTLLVLLGFVLGSLIRVWPWYDGAAIREAQILRTGVADPLNLEIPGAVLWCVIGVALVVVFDLLGSRSARKAA
jgi:putative membrane protein